MPNKFRILAVDGGGIRGIIPGVVLVELERQLQQVSGNPNARLADYFDLVAGTSTGGLLACGILCPGGPHGARYTAPELLDIYLNRGDEVFRIPLGHTIRTLGGLADEKYPDDGLLKILSDYFGDVKLSQLLKPCAVLAYDIRRTRAVIFAQHDAVHDLNEDFYVRDVAHATAAAPTYFEVAEVKSMNNQASPLCDGGVFAANPALCGFVEATKVVMRSPGPFPFVRGTLTPKDVVLLSLGTGYVDQGWEYSQARNWGKADWIKPLIDIIFDGQSQTVDYALRSLFTASGVAGQYVRLDVELPPGDGAAMDNAAPKNLQALRMAGNSLVQSSVAEIQRVVGMLR